MTPPVPASQPASQPASLFVSDGDMVCATELSRGPWDPASCHGGPVAALLVRTCEGIESLDDQTDWQLARITVELVRPVPVLTPLFVTAEVERPGRNVSLIGTRLSTEQGVEVARARALRIRSAEVELPDTHLLEPPFGDPGRGVTNEPGFPGEQTTFHRDAVEMRFADGSWLDRGPVALWCRLLHPVLPDEEPSGAQRAIAAADFGNGVSTELDPAEMLFINPDLTMHLLRQPEGEWIGMQARSHYGRHGAGLAESALFDARGRCGRSVQSLFVAPR